MKTYSGLGWRAAVVAITMLLAGGRAYGSPISWIEECEDGPPLISSKLTSVDGRSSIRLASPKPSAVRSSESVALTVESAPVDVTYTKTWGAYTTTCRVCYYYGGYSVHCFPEPVSFDKKVEKVGGSAYPRGTVAVKENGRTVGTTRLSGAQAPFTAPAVSAVGTVTFVAEFTPADDSGFSPDVSNAVSVESTLDPAVLLPVTRYLSGE